jgi:N-acetylmuramoyl-L-alanine amidase
MPSVLVETGFLTNKKEGAYLNSKKGQTEMSKSIAKGILRYRNSISSEVIKNDSELFSDLDKNYNDKYFLKIQIASSSKKVPLKSYNFKGLGNLSYLKNNNTYRYYFERTQDYTLAKLMLKRAVKSGYKDALIVAFKNDKSITIEEYLSSYKK